MLLAAVGCDGPPGGGGEVDAGSACGLVDQECCLRGSACEEDLVCAADDGGAPPRCYSPCTPTPCTAGGNSGSCLEVGGGRGVCADSGSAPAGCVAGAEGCETTHGTSEGTMCVSDGALEFCFEACVPEPSGCASTHVCVPLADGGGLCLTGQ